MTDFYNLVHQIESLQESLTASQFFNGLNKKRAKNILGVSQCQSRKGAEESKGSRDVEGHSALLSI